MSDLSHLEYLFTRDSFTGLARPDPRALLGAGWGDQQGQAAAPSGNPHPGLAGKHSDASAGAAVSAFDKYQSPAATHQRPMPDSSLPPYLQQTARAASSLGKGGWAGGAAPVGRPQLGYGGASDGRWGAGAMPPLNGSMPMAATAFAMAQRNLLLAETPAAGSNLSGKAAPLTAAPVGKQTGKASAAPAAKPAAAGAASTERTDTITCQVCSQVVPSNSIRKYIRVRKICNDCRTSDCVLKNGKNMRFCQLCSWFHPVDNFEGTRHSCKSALEKHNERRRQKTVKSKGADDAGGSEAKSESSQ